MKKTKRCLPYIAMLLFSCLSLTGCKTPKTAYIFDVFEAQISEIPTESTDVSLEGEPLPAQEEMQDRPSEEEAEVIPPPEKAFRYEAPLSDTAPYQAVCAKTNVCIRNGPSVGHDLLFVLTAGDSLPYLWKEGEWLAVWTGERVGFLNGNYAYLTETNLAIERVIRAGLAKLGTPYEWGAPRVLTDQGRLNPSFTGNSFDCSSFVQYCYYVGCGIKLGNYTGSQADHTVGKVIADYADLRRGDFYFTGSGSISHVVIYLGNGTLLQTYSANGGPVSLTSDERWKDKFLSGRRPDLTVVDQYS